MKRSLANLRAAGALTPEGLRAIPLAKLRRLIRPSGFITRKAPALKAFVTMLDKEFGGSLEALAATPTAALRERLLALPGVGPETADAILLYALGHPVPVADEYLRRIADRHELIAPEPGRKHISYACAHGTDAAGVCGRCGAGSGAALQRVPRADRGRGQGALRKDGAVRGVSAGKRSMPLAGS